MDTTDDISVSDMKEGAYELKLKFCLGFRLSPEETVCNEIIKAYDLKKEKSDFQIIDEQRKSHKVSSKNMVKISNVFEEMFEKTNDSTNHWQLRLTPRGVQG